jgi:hypothetical protein
VGAVCFLANGGAKSEYRAAQIALLSCALLFYKTQCVFRGSASGCRAYLVRLCG